MREIGAEMEVGSKGLKPRDWHMNPPKPEDMWGDRQLIALTIGPGGGSRFWYKILEETRVARIVSDKKSEQRMDALIAAQVGWRMVWVVGHDMTITGVCIADSRGVHEHDLDTERSHESYQSYPWVGQEPLSEAELVELFAGITVPTRVIDLPR